ncbi:MAG: hypothetical protein ACXADS_14510 [Candidatus Thorarchaeota archaeon]|jgi:hypothetical protein
MADKDPKDTEAAESPFTAENRVKKEMITLGGMARTEEGKITRTDFFRFIGHNLDDYDEIELSPTEARRIHTHLQKLSTGSTAMVPMYCGGPQCPFALRCPLQQIDKAPIGKQCLIEVQLMKDWIIRYFDEYDVDPNNFTEIAYINELAEIEILLMRLNMNIAKVENAELVIDQVAGFTNDGTPIVQKMLSPFMELKDRLQSRRSKVIKLMVGDRQEKYKKEAALKVKLDQDPSSKMATMRGKLENLQRQLDQFSSTPVEGSPAPKKEGTSPQDLIDAED